MNDSYLAVVFFVIYPIGIETRTSDPTLSKSKACPNFGHAFVESYTTSGFKPTFANTYLLALTTRQNQIQENTHQGRQADTTNHESATGDLGATDAQRQD